MHVKWFESGIIGDELLGREILTTLEEAKGLIEQQRREYNQMRSYNILRCQPPDPEATFNFWGG